MHKYKDISKFIGGAKAITAVGENLPMRDQSLDLVVCINALDHVLDINNVLSNIKRILKPTGHFYLDVHVQTALDEFFEKRGYKAPLYEYHPHELKLKEFLDLLATYGFKIEKIHFDKPLSPILMLKSFFKMTYSKLIKTENKKNLVWHPTVVFNIPYHTQIFNGIIRTFDYVFYHFDRRRFAIGIKVMLAKS